jgi:hypothetical protein
MHDVSAALRTHSTSTVAGLSGMGLSPKGAIGDPTCVIVPARAANYVAATFFSSAVGSRPCTRRSGWASTCSRR